MGPYRASIYLSLAILTLLSPLAMSFAVAISGRGISYATDFDLKGALKSAAGGGLAGAMAMVLQVLALMPLRTLMNTQYRYGGTFKETSKKLWGEGKLPRFYAGLGAAL